MIGGLYTTGPHTVASGGGGGGSLTAGGYNYSGAGSPEGVQSGSPFETYYDTTNDAVYTKKSGSATTTGWIMTAISGT